MNILIYIFLMSSMLISVNAGMNTFYGSEKTSYAKYRTWQSSIKGVLFLTFKTTEPDGLLLYADDQHQMRGNGNFIKIKLLDKCLVIQVQISFSTEHLSFKSEGKSFKLGTQLNDNREHVVKIQRYNQNLTMSLDGQMETYVPPNKMSLYINSSIFVGGIPPNANVAWMDNSILNEKRFTGCIGKLTYNGDVALSSNQNVIEEKGEIDKGCQDKCMSEPTLQCKNGGLCVNMYVKTGCDCRGTGFTGQTCQKTSKSISISNPGSYMIWTPYNVDYSHNLEITMRFKHDGRSGVGRHKEESLLLHGTDGKKSEGRLSIRLQGNSVVATTSSKGEVKDEIKLSMSESSKAMWNFIQIFTNARSLSLKLHDGFSQKSYMKEYRPGVYDNSLPEFKKFYIGGGLSGINFTGCMQDVVVNKVDLVTKLAEKAKDMKVVGTISDECNETSKQNQGAPTNMLTGVSSLNAKHRNTKVDLLKTQGVTNVQGVQNTENGNHENKRSNVWIIVASVGSVVVFVVVTVIAVRHLLRRRYKRIDRYNDHILRKIESEQAKGTTSCLREQFNQHAHIPASGKEHFMSSRAHSECGSTLSRSIPKCIHPPPNVFHHQHPVFENMTSNDSNHSTVTSSCKRHREMPTEFSTSYCKRLREP